MSAAVQHPASAGSESMWELRRAAGAGAESGAGAGGAPPSSTATRAVKPDGGSFHPASKDYVPFVVGDRVSATFGDPVKSTQPLVIKGFKFVGDVCMYEAEFVNWTLAYDTKPRGFFKASSLQPRDILVSEVLDDAAELRLAGNEFFKAGKVQSALDLYRKSLLCVASLGKKSYADLQPHIQTLIKLRLTTMSNLTQCFLKTDPPQHQKAVTIASDALKLDPMDATKTRKKLLFRRATAFIALQQFDKAIEDLVDPLHAGDSLATKKLEYARASLKRQKKLQDKKANKMWSGAFKKNSTPGTVGAGAGSGAAGSGSGSESPMSASGSPVVGASAGQSSEAAATTTAASGDAPKTAAGLLAAVDQAEEAATKGSSADAATDGDDHDGEGDDDDDEDESLWKTLAVVGGVLAVAAGAAFLWRRSRRKPF